MQYYQEGVQANLEIYARSSQKSSLNRLEKDSGLGDRDILIREFHILVTTLSSDTTDLQSGWDTTLPS